MEVFTAGAGSDGAAHAAVAEESVLAVPDAAAVSSAEESAAAAPAQDAKAGQQFLSEDSAGRTGGKEGGEGGGGETVHPFVTEAGDHAETPIEAYQHIAPLLARIAHRLQKPVAELVVYDPYYCEGKTGAVEVVPTPP